MIKILKAKIKDAQQIRLLEKQVWSEEVTSKYDCGIFVRFGYSYIAKDNDNLIGAIIGCKTKADDIYILDLVVDKKYRQNGIGLKLYSKLIKDNKGCNIITFLDKKNLATIKMHKKLGFTIVKQIKDVYGLKDLKDVESSSFKYLVKLKNI